MSLYCKGTECPKSQQCLRAEAYRDLVAVIPSVEASSVYECTASGIWLVNMQHCIRHDFANGVFVKTCENL